MAPNPIMIPRKPVQQPFAQRVPRRDASKPSLSKSYFASAAVVGLVATLPWARSWLLSGAAVESLFLIYGDGLQRRIISQIPLWTLLATLNLAYAICSTSWLLYGLFAGVCYVACLLTALSQFSRAANAARKVLRKTLGKHPQFIRDKLALFNLPALEIDTDVDGLFVIRGVTLSFSNLTLVAHGIELGLKLAEDIELAIYVDEVIVRFFRNIEIGDVYANVKGDKIEMTFGEMEEPTDDATSETSVFLDDTPLLRAANAGGKTYKDRPKLRQSLTGVSFMKDSSAQAGLDQVETLDPDDERADKQYYEKLREIRGSSAVYQSRKQVEERARTKKDIKVDDVHDKRAAISTELHTLPSVPHPPSRSVRVTTLQNLSPPHIRRFLHRLPFLLRLLLAPLSYFHPISVDSVNAAGSGKWLSSMLNRQVFKQYTANNAELRRLQRSLSKWTADANFCVELTEILGLAQVPLSTNFDIITYLKFNEVIAYRVVPQSGTITQVIRLGGADATFTIPSYLLPHHEHIIPPEPTIEDEKELEISVEDVDGTPKALQAEADLEKLRKDETTVAISAHASLPASCDQSLLNFIAALVKATKIIELEKEIDDADPNAPPTPVSTTYGDSDAESINSTTPSTVSTAEKLHMKDIAGFKGLAKHIRQNLSDGTTRMQIKEFAKDLHESTKSGMKKAMVSGLVNDRWIARMVGKVAAALQNAQGDLGYSGAVPVPLAPYRALAEPASKLLP